MNLNPWIRLSGRAALAAGALFVAAFGCCATLAAAQSARPADRNPDFTFKQPSPAELQEGMALWQELGRAGIYHERLDYFVGEWDLTTKVWMQGPEAPAQESRGTASFRWLMEGRWLAQEMTGEMMGMPLRGFALMGYDNYRREYVGVWVDDMSTTMLTISGRLDQSGKVLAMYGEMDEPTSGELGKMVKYVTRIVDDDTHVFEIHDLAIGGDRTMVMEVTYERK
jgi:hypothetical protein